MKSDEGENLEETLMPPIILTEAEMNIACQRKERVSCFVKTYWESTGHHPSDVEIACHLE